MFLLSGHLELSSSTDLWQDLVNDLLTVFSGVESATFLVKVLTGIFYVQQSSLKTGHSTNFLNQDDVVNYSWWISWLCGYHWKTPDRDFSKPISATNFIGKNGDHYSFNFEVVTAAVVLLTSFWVSFLFTYRLLGIQNFIRLTPLLSLTEDFS